MTVRQVEIGKNAYLWHKSDQVPPNTRCIITAHGGLAATLKMSMKLNRPDVVLRYYSTHNFATADMGLESVGNSLSPVVEEHTAYSSPNYLLSKYTNSTPGLRGRHSHNDNFETYSSVRRFVDHKQADVVTIRSRYGFQPVLLSTVLQDIWEAGFGYSVFDCYFCRGFRSAQ